MLPLPSRRRRRRPSVVALIGLVAALLPRPAAAQYKNISVAVDGGWDVISRPSILGTDGTLITDPAYFPLRLSEGGRLGLETNVKMHSDHWWVHFRLNAHLMRVGTRGDPADSDQLAFDALARQGLGTTLGLEPVVGLRYYFLTDRVRPYLQAGLSYMRLFGFTDTKSCLSGGTDGSDRFCDANGSNLATYLPHQNIISLQAQPGIELILRRDLALTLTFGYSHWFIFNAQDNDVFTPAVGLIIFG